jgi:transposase-like protein
MSEVARRLGIGRSTLSRKLKEFGLEPQATGEVVADVESDGTALEEAIRKAG